MVSIVLMFASKERLIAVMLLKDSYIHVIIIETEQTIYLPVEAAELNIQDVLALGSFHRTSLCVSSIQHDCSYLVHGVSGHKMKVRKKETGSWF